jgi:hypothetical protein
LIIELNLDASKFSDGAKSAVTDLRHMQEQAEESGKRVSAVSVKLTDVFSTVKKGAVGMIGAFVGAEFAAAMDNVARLDNQLGRVAITSGHGVDTLGRWEGAVRAIGGEAGAATAAIDAMQNAINEYQRGNVSAFPAGAFPILNAAGINPNEQGLQAEDVYQRLAKYFDREVGAGRLSRSQEATQLRDLGINAGMIDLMLKGADAFNKLRNSIRGATEESVEASNRYIENQSKVAKVITDIYRAALEILVHPLTIAKGSLIDKLANGEPNAAARWYRENMPDWMIAHPRGAPTSANEGLNPEFGSALDRLRAAMPAGMNFSINSGFRTHEQQAELYRLRPDLAAPPGYSPHERGTAADLQFNSDAARAWAHAHAVEFGLSFPVGREPWHVEPSRARGGALMPIAPPSGARPGSTGASTTNTSSVSIQNLTVVTQSSDAQGMFKDIDSHLRRVAKVAPANYGLA